MVLTFLAAPKGEKWITSTLARYRLPYSGSHVKYIFHKFFI